jgi:hypothetical protein
MNTNIITPPHQQQANNGLLVKSESSANMDSEYALNSSYEVLISMKIFDAETTQQLWGELPARAPEPGNCGPTCD